MKKKVLITGASGLLAKKIQANLSHSYQVVFLSTNKSLVNNSDVFFWDISKGIISKNVLLDCNSIIHLSGYSISHRWTKANKQKMYNSRIGGANLIFKKCVELGVSPEIFISASAIGYYGSLNSDHKHKETDKAGRDWLSRLVVDWEQAADQFKSIQCKVVKLRFSLLLSKDGGILKQMLRSFKFNVGFILGNGNQTVEWIHINDVAKFVLYIINSNDLNNNIEGAFNVSANATSQIEFVKTVRNVFQPNSILIKLSSWLLKIFFSEQSVILLSDCKVSCAKLRNTDFSIEYRNLKDAIKKENDN